MKKRIKGVVFFCIIALCVFGSTCFAEEAYLGWQQDDPSWGNIYLGNSQYTMASDGCLVTSMAIALRDMGYTANDFSPKELINRLNQLTQQNIDSGFTSGGLYYWNSLTKINSSMSSALKYSANITNIRNDISITSRVVANVLNGGHWVYVKSVSDNGTLYVSDPLSLRSSYNISNVSRYAVISYSGATGGGGSSSSAPALSSPLNNVTFSINTNISFSWSSIGSRYHLVITNPSGSSSDFFTNGTSYNYTPNVGGTWKWKVRVESDTGSTGPWSEERSITITDNNQPPPPSGAYSVQYFNNGTCSGTVASTETGLASINKNWGTSSAPNGCGTNTFSAVFTGNINFSTGWYRFNYTVDDSIKLILTRDNGFYDSICDNNGQKDSPQSGGRYYYITSAGTYTVRVEYSKCHAGTAVVQASWSPIAPPMMNMTFDSQGGSYVSTVTAVYESLVAKPADPARPGYAFGGWYKQSNFAEPWNFLNDRIKDNTTVYAKWNSLPDLMPTSITFNNNELGIGKTILLDTGIRNNGNASSPYFGIKWFIDDQQVGYGGHEGIPVNTIVMNGNSGYYWTPSAAGTYLIDFVIDPDNNVIESNELNNVISVAITVPEDPVIPVKISSLTPNIASPQPTGTSVTWTCNASGGKSLQYQFYIYTSTTGWKLVRAYSSSNAYSWAPTTAGDYGICVWVKDATSPNAYDATLSNGYRAFTPVQIHSIQPNKASPQPIGSSVMWTCAANGGTSLQYQFYIHTSATGWQLARAYSSNNTFSWTPTTAGDYGICVWVKDTASSNAYDATISSGYRLYTPVMIRSVTPNKASPQTTGTPIRWTCAANGGTSLRYQFYIYTSETGWQLARAYSSSNIFDWTPTNSGDYGVCVWVKDAASSHDYDASMSNGFRTFTPVTISSMAPNIASPQPAGTSVTWICAAKGGYSSLQYQFFVHTDSSGWVMVQPYSRNNSVTLTSSGAGNYGICVWVKDEVSTNQYDASSSSGFRTYVPVSVNSLTPNKASPQPASTPVTWSCNASGGAFLQYQFYVYTTSSGWVLAQPYSSSNTITLTTSMAEDYGICVWVKDAASSNSYDATMSNGYRIYTPVSINVLTPNITSPQPTGTSVIWTCGASGGSSGGSSLQYQFYVYTDSSGWVLVQSYSSSNTITLTSSSAGYYGVCVWVKEADSTNSYDAYLSDGYQIVN